MSRDFLPEAWQSNFSERIRPAAVEEMLEIRDYFSFLRALEDRAHDTIPTFARGDFMVVTAPNGELGMTSAFVFMESKN